MLPDVIDKSLTFVELLTVSKAAWYSLRAQV